MLSSILINDVNKLIRAALDAETLFAILSELAATHAVIDAQIPAFLQNSDRWNAPASQIHTQLASAARTLQGKSLRQIFAAAELMADALQVFEAGFPMPPDAPLSTAVKDFAALLDTFSTSHSAEHGASLIEKGSRLSANLTRYISAQEGTVERLYPEPIGDEDDTLTLVLYEAHSLAEIADKLLTLQDICTFLEKALRQSDDLDVSFRVRKIETDCLSVELLAQKIGIAALKRLLSAGAQYVYRNYTTEGKLKYGVPLAVDALSKMVKLSATLKKAGIDSVKIDEQITQNSTFLAEKVGKLIGHKEVRVDGDSYSPEVEVLLLPAPPSPQGPARRITRRLPKPE